MAKTKLRIGSRLDLGQMRDNQEDSLRIYLPEQQVVQEEKGALFIVADGVGGHQAGDVASALATEVLTNAYYASASHNVEDALREAVAAANTHIYQEAQARASQAGMGSTCVVVALRGNHIGVANVGDSRAY
ncbi:MAG: serine/threonine-protein phosphatase, partial [Candidatus Chloroheliales bacterium]